MVQPGIAANLRLTYGAVVRDWLCGKLDTYADIAFSRRNRREMHAGMLTDLPFASVQDPAHEMVQSVFRVDLPIKISTE